MDVVRDCSSYILHARRCRDQVMSAVHALVGRKKKHSALDSEGVLQKILLCGPPPKPANLDYWRTVTQELFPNRNPTPKLIKAVSTQWYCNRDGIRSTHRLAVSEKVKCARSE